LLLLIYRCVNLKTVQNKESFHYSMAGAFAAIHKGVVLDKEKTQGRCFLNNRRIQFPPPNVMRGWAKADSNAPKS